MMIVLPTRNRNIAQAHECSGGLLQLPYLSFAHCFFARVHDPLLSHRLFLSYLDDDCQIHRTYTYKEFGDLVARTATVLQEACGLVRGDRIATVLFNHDQTVMVYFAAWTLGVSVVPISLESTIEQQQFILEHSEASVVFGWHTELENLHAACAGISTVRRIVPVDDAAPPGSLGALLADAKPAAYEEDGSLKDEALLVYTSGTTGPPKGVVLTIENLLADADAISTWHGFDRDGCLMCVLPIHHVNGIVVTLVTPFYCRGRVVLQRKFKTPTFWKHLEEEGVSCVSVVPTILEFLLEASEDVSSYRLDRFRGFICGAGPLHKETAGRCLDQFQTVIRHGYGLSETTCYSCFLPNEMTKAQYRHWLTDYEFPSIGVPIPHNDMVIVDAEGKPLPEGERGEICIRGQTVCSGYFKRPDANDAAFQWGWFRSGDEGFFLRGEHNHPFFFLSGRLKELIIRGGVNLSPLEIDEVLASHPQVRFAMAIPFEHRWYGEEIAGYVVPKDGAATLTEAMVLDYCRKRLPFAKSPKVIVFGKDVPYTTTGKPKRLALKEQLAHTLEAFREVQWKDPSKRTPAR